MGGGGAMLRQGTVSSSMYPGETQNPYYTTQPQQAGYDEDYAARTVTSTTTEFASRIPHAVLPYLSPHGILSSFSSSQLTKESRMMPPFRFFFIRLTGFSSLLI